MVNFQGNKFPVIIPEALNYPSNVRMLQDVSIQLDFFEKELLSLNYHKK